MLRFEDKVVAITGAGQGIGRSTAITFAAAGAKVAVIDLNYADADQTVKIIISAGGKALAQAADISQAIQVKETMDLIIKKWGRLDILVNNAGIYRQGDLLNTSIDDWNAVLAVNLTGAFLCSRESVSLMLKNGSGTIVNVASEAGLVGIKGQVAYNVSKAALIGLTRSMAVDHAPFIRVNCVCPGTTDTPLVAKALREAADPALMRRNLENSRPLDRLGKPEEIAWAIIMLAGDSMGYATGAVLSIDGGYTAQ